MLIGSAIVMSILESISLKAENKFPVVSCQNIAKSFTGKDSGAGDAGPDAAGQARWKEAALKEYERNMKLKEHGHPEHFDGVMECFCQ